MKKPPSLDSKTRHLSVIPGGKPEELAPLTRAQVASQIGPEDVRLFDAVEVAALAAELADEPRARRLRNAAREPGAKPAPRSADEVAAEVFERLEQRQSLAEIVVGVRVTPERVRELHEQWCRGLIEGQLRYARAPQVPLDRLARSRRSTLRGPSSKFELPGGDLDRARKHPAARSGSVPRMQSHE
jgi:hypothetical protein